jgi:hypothetical protein
MKTFKLRKSKMAFIQLVFLLVYFLFVLSCYFRWIPGNYKQISITALFLFFMPLALNVCTYFTSYFNTITVNPDKIILKSSLRTTYYILNEMKTVFFYKFNHSQLVVNTTNGKKKYIPIKVVDQEEFLNLLKAVLTEYNLYTTGVEKGFNKILKR